MIWLASGHDDDDDDDDDASAAAADVMMIAEINVQRLRRHTRRCTNFERKF